MGVDIHVGTPGDVDDALAVYERSNLARRRGDWPERTARLAHVASALRRADSWFLIARDGTNPVGMALVLPYRNDRGAGREVPAAAFLDLVYVEPDRWGEGIGTAILKAVVNEARHRGSTRLHLWTHEADNERAQRLYQACGFRRTGVTTTDPAGEPVAEWVRFVSRQPDRL